MFIEVITRELQKRKITQKQLCKELNIRESTYTSWKSGAIPNFDIAMKVLKYLEISVDEMYGIQNFGLSEDEKELIKLYRGTDEKSREIIKATAQAAAFSKSCDSDKSEVS